MSNEIEINMTGTSVDWVSIESSQAKIGDEYQLGGKMITVSGQTVDQWKWRPITNETWRNAVCYYQLPCRRRLERPMDKVITDDVEIQLGETRRKYYAMLDESMNETTEGESFLPVFVGKVIAELRNNK